MSVREDVAAPGPDLPRASHLLVRVGDLHQAVSDFEAAGFRVTWGAEPAKAHNALIHFERGPFLELFDPIPHGALGVAMRAAVRIGAAVRVPDLMRMGRWIDADGLCELALEVDGSLEPVVAGIAERGVPMGGVRNMSRTQPDGVRLAWSVSAARDAKLPFVMGPYRPAPVIPDDARAHPNGARACQALYIRDPEPEAWADELMKVLGHGELRGGGDRVAIEAGDFAFRVEGGAEHGLAGIELDKAPGDDARLHGLTIRTADDEARRWV